MSELEFVSSAVKLIRQRYPNIKMCIEAPILGRSVDLALIRGNRTIAIEFKLKNWKQALKQASDYKLACDLSYVCLPQNKVSEDVIISAKKCGVGVLVVSNDNVWPFKTIVNAAPSKEKWQRASVAFREYIISSENNFA